MQPFELNQYKQTLRALSERIVEAQKPIRILNSLKWPAEVQAQFFEKKCRELPQVTEATYQKNALQFEPKEKKEEFYAIERDIRRQLGQFSGVANVMLRICREYREVIRLIEARGTLEFTKISQELYGSSQDAFYAGAPTLRDLAESVTATLSRIKIQEIDPQEEKCYTSEQAVQILGERLAQYFGDDDRQIHVKLSDDIVADASAGAEYIKLRKDALFSERDLRAYEVHEGWVHIGTTLNGLAQPVCTFLSKGPPSSTINQEGLAIIMEIFTFSSYPHRVRRLTQRVSAIDMAERGADFLDVFRYYCEEGLKEDESYNAAVRVFRGCLPNAGPFTKDLSYSKGFVLIYNYIRLAIKNGLQSRIPLLFLGKTTLEDLHVLADLQEEGIVTPPKYLPPQFKDLAALTAWMVYSLFLNRLSLDQLTVDYKGILHE
ncbi:MAG TPA: flavohemoglobin expression-modulating QEGLA motif protein [Gammaproteobacteria bacterium]|nr:flavohemoglobin expression-modulating QEGLA motif protein [Gammaproteobacteria bacterium]